jgi:chromosome segregation ATPase
MSARRLEMSVEQLKNKTSSQLAELGKKSDAINRLKIELGEKNATIFALEAREKALKNEQRATEEEFSSKTQALRAAEQELADKRAELGKLTSELSERSTTAESRQNELAAVRGQVDELQNRVKGAERDYTETQQRLTIQRSDADTVARELAEARGKVDNLNARVGDLDRQLLVQSKEAELLSGRVTDLESRLALQGKILAEREYENNLLRQQVEAAQKTETQLRGEIGSVSGTGQSSIIEKLKAEKAAIEEQLGVARDERAKAQRELNLVHQQTEAAWSTERTENALLRERINDIAAEVAKLAVTLEGPNSPIEAILSSEPDKPAISAIVRGTAANDAGINGAADEARGTLAERIKALQAHASRARQPG